MYMQLRLQATYRRRVIRRYLSLPPSWHRRNATGKLLSTASSDVDAAWTPAGTMGYALATVVLFVAALVALFLTDWALALVGLVLFPTLFAVFEAFSRRVAPRYRRSQQLRGEVSAIAHESFDGAMVVKTMGREDDETARFAAQGGRAARRADPRRPAARALRAGRGVAAQRRHARRAGDRRVAAAAGAIGGRRAGQRGVPVRRAGVPGPGDRLAAHRVAARGRRLGAGAAVLDREGDDGLRRRGSGRRPGRRRAEIRRGDLRLRRRAGRCCRTCPSRSRPGDGRPGRADRGGQVGRGLAGRAAGRPGSRHGQARRRRPQVAAAGALADAIGAGAAGAVRLRRHGKGQRHARPDRDRRRWVWEALRVAQAEGFVRQLAEGLDTVLGERGGSCPVGSASGSPWRVRWPGGRGCSCSTTPPAPWTRASSRRSWPRCAVGAQADRCSSSPTGRPRSPPPTRWCTWWTVGWSRRYPRGIAGNRAGLRNLVTATSRPRRAPRWFESS